MRKKFKKVKITLNIIKTGLSYQDNTYKKL